MQFDELLNSDSEQSLPTTICHNQELNPLTLKDICKTFVCLFVSRFEKGRIYTFIGEVVVSVNPYKQMDIYGKEEIEKYRGRELYENPPHLYAVADAAYKAMKRRAKDTCIVISGEH